MYTEGWVNAGHTLTTVWVCHHRWLYGQKRLRSLFEAAMAPYIRTGRFKFQVLIFHRNPFGRWLLASDLPTAPLPENTPLAAKDGRRTFWHLFTDAPRQWNHCAHVPVTCRLDAYTLQRVLKLLTS